MEFFKWLNKLATFFGIVLPITLIIWFTHSILWLFGICLGIYIIALSYLIHIKKIKVKNKSFILIAIVSGTLISIILFPQVTAPRNTDCYKTIAEDQCGDNPYYFVWDFKFGFLADEFDYLCCPIDYYKGVNKTICKKKNPDLVKFDDCDWHKFREEEYAKIKECKRKEEGGVNYPTLADGVSLPCLR